MPVRRGAPHQPRASPMATSRSKATQPTLHSDVTHEPGWERDAAMATLAQRRIAGMRAVPVPGQIEMFG